MQHDNVHNATFHPTSEAMFNTGIPTGRIGTPVQQEIEGVVLQARKRGEISPLPALTVTADSGSVASTSTSPEYNQVLKRPSSGRRLRVESVEATTSSLNVEVNTNAINNVSTSNIAQNTAVGLQGQGQGPQQQHQQGHIQMQRLGALAAALDAGDAVGKLMAQMMIGGK